jgi:hypothetical protein
MKQRLKEMEDEGGYEAAPAAAEAKPDGGDTSSTARQ